MVGQSVVVVGVVGVIDGIPIGRHWAVDVALVADRSMAVGPPAVAAVVLVAKSVPF